MFYSFEQITVTTGYNFEGYKIEEYLGLASGEIALNTNYLRDTRMNLGDLFEIGTYVEENGAVGRERESQTNKLENARRIAISRLVTSAKERGANAVIGVDVDYITINEVLGVVAMGTAVRIKAKNPDTGENYSYSFPVGSYSTNEKLRPCFVSVQSAQQENESFLSVVFHNYSDLPVGEISVDVEIKNEQNETVYFPGLQFRNLRTADRRIESELVAVPAKEEDFTSVCLCSVQVLRYKAGNVWVEGAGDSQVTTLTMQQLTDHKSVFGQDAVTVGETTDNRWKCVCGAFNAEGELCNLCGRTVEATNAVNNFEQIIATFEQEERAKGIYERLLSFENSIAPPVFAELSKELKRITMNERMYGNSKADALIVVKKLLLDENNE